MTIEELLRKLKKLRELSDPEKAHFEADHLLLVYIADQDINDVYSDIEKWYA